MGLILRGRTPIDCKIPKIGEYADEVDEAERGVAVIWFGTTGRQRKASDNVLSAISGGKGSFTIGPT
jgi:hypothetical protein